MMPALAQNGVMIAGDAAGMCVNIGYTVRGMDFAIAAGRYAGETAIQAHKDHKFNRDELSKYAQLLNQSFVLQEMGQYANASHALNNERVFNAYPKLACGLMSDIFTVDGRPRGIFNKFYDNIKTVSTLNLLKDGIQILRSI